MMEPLSVLIGLVLARKTTDALLLPTATRVIWFVPSPPNRLHADVIQGSWTVLNGVISQKKTLDLLILNGRNSILGRGVILHSIPDPCDSVGLSC